MGVQSLEQRKEIAKLTEMLKQKVPRGKGISAHTTDKRYAIVTTPLRIGLQLRWLSMQLESSACW